MADALRPDAAALELLLRRLRGPRPFRTDDLARFRQLQDAGLTHPAGWEICPQGRALESPRLVASGFVAEARVMRDGRRQIFALRLPGDLLGLDARPQPFSLQALTNVQTVDAGAVAQALADPSSRFDPLRAAWERLKAEEEARLLDHVLRLGRFSAYERAAHLLLELHERLLAAGLATSGGFRLPLTQAVLADVLGLSVVHVSRTFQELARARVITYGGGRVGIPDRDRLARAAGAVCSDRWAARATSPGGRALEASP